MLDNDSFASDFISYENKVVLEMEINREINGKFMEINRDVYSVELLVCKTFISLIDRDGVVELHNDLFSVFISHMKIERLIAECCWLYYALS